MRSNARARASRRLCGGRPTSRQSCRPTGRSCTRAPRRSSCSAWRRRSSPAATSRSSFTRTTLRPGCVRSARVTRDSGGETMSDWRLRHQDGHYVDTESRVANLLDDPNVDGILINTRDVSERKRLEHELRNQALQDPLTGLANRTLLSDRLDRALALQAPETHNSGVLFLDLDDFKSVNDSLGPRRRRRAAAGGRPQAGVGGADRGHRRPPRRRRVRDHAGRHALGSGRRRHGRPHPRHLQAPVSPGEGRDVQQREHRHRPCRRRDSRRCQPASRGGHRDVCGEGLRQGPSRDLSEGHARAGDRSTPARGGPATCGRTQRARGRLSADRRPGHRNDDRRRSVDALETSGTGAADPRTCSSPSPRPPGSSSRWAAGCSARHAATYEAGKTWAAVERAS